VAINWNLYEKRLKIDGINVRDSQINLTKDSIIDNFRDTPSYRLSYINESTSSTGIQVIDNKNAYVKTIVMQPNDSINVGDIFEFDNLKWICIEADKTNPVNERGIVYQAKHTITLNKNHILYNIPCIVESAVRLYQLGDKDNKYLSEPSTNIIIRVPNNDITRLIKRSDVYKIGMQNYRVVDVNDVIESGLLVLKMEFALSEQPKDSITTVTILNGEEINMNYQGQTLQLNVEVKVNDEIIPNPEITYTSSNEDIATVDENGLVTTILNGICTITATYNDVSDSIDINSVTIIPDDFEIVLTPTNANTIKIGTSLVLEAHAMNNGVEDLTKHFNWYLINVDGSSNTYATIVSNDKTCIINASNSYSHINKYIKIKAELVGDVTVFTEKQIKLISLI